MSFTDAQLRYLRAPIRSQHIREREVDGKVLSYLEGWHVIAEANRIFGFDGWDRETLSTQCVWQKQIDQRYGTFYLTRIRITVRAGDKVIQREGLGSGEAYASTPGQAHERASKAAETDATKRALCTFGNPFGLSLYKSKSETKINKRPHKAAQKDISEAPTVTMKADVEREEIKSSKDWTSISEIMNKPYADQGREAEAQTRLAAE